MFEMCALFFVFLSFDADFASALMDEKGCGVAYLLQSSLTQSLQLLCDWTGDMFLHHCLPEITFIHQ